MSDAARQAAPLRYVVLRHEGIDEPHFDLMIEYDSNYGLMTWRSAEWPIVRPIQLHPLGDHRREYLDYEGPLSGNRGSVRRVAGGTYAWSMDEQRQDQTLRFLTGPPHPTLLIDHDSFCRPIDDSNSA